MANLVTNTGGLQEALNMIKSRTVDPSQLETENKTIIGAINELNTKFNDGGADGREIELLKGATHIQWRYVGETSWNNLVALADLKGANGKEVQLQKTSTHIQWRLTDGSWANLVALSDLKGESGVGISNIAKTNTSGKVDTYTITLTNGTTKTFTVTNGDDGDQGPPGNSIIISNKQESAAAGGTNVLTFSDGTTLNIKNGSDGNSVTITNLNQNNSAGGTSTITFSDGKKLDIKNGEDGDDGKSVELQKTSSHIQWRQTNGNWTNLVALSDLKGQDGGDGGDGNDGREIELRKSSGYVQWHYVGETGWQNLIALSDLKGADGKQVQLQKGTSAIQWKYNTDTTWTNLVNLSDIKGDKPVKGQDYFTAAEIDDIATKAAGKMELDADLTAIARLAGTSGLLKKTAANTWSLDTNTYLTSSSLNGYATQEWVGQNYTNNTGTVTSIATGTGLSGGTITSSGTISLTNATARTVADTGTHHLTYRDGGAGAMGYDSSIFIGGVLGELNATTFKVNQKSTIQYNTAEGCLEFAFV